MENNIITIKFSLNKNITIDNNLYFEIINALNNQLLPCNEIYLNDVKVFDSQKGFIKGNS